MLITVLLGSRDGVLEGSIDCLAGNWPCPSEIRLLTSRLDVRSPALCRTRLIMHSPEIFDEYTRRQYQAKAPHRNPFGDEEEPTKFVEFDIFTKV